MEPIQLSLRVPATFTLPKFYHTESPDKTSLALRLGAIAAQAAEETIREECNSDLVTQLEKKHITTRDRLEREKRGLEESLTHLQSKLSIDESLKSDLRKQIQDECRSTFRELLAEKDKQIDRASRENQALQERLQKLADSLNRQVGSQEKGRIGELRVEDLITRAFGMGPGFELIAKGKEAQSGDHHMMYNNMKVIWETKNYGRAVNKDEVEKLRRDMRSNPDVKVAFMVSLTNGIAGHTKPADIDLERLEDGRFIVYLSNLYKHEDPVLYLQGLRPLLELGEYMGVHKERADSEELSQMKVKAQIIQHLLKNHMTTLQNLRNSLVNQKKKMDQIYAEQMSLVKQAETELVSTLKELLSEEEQQGIVKGLLNPELYTKQSILDCTEKEKKRVLWFQQHCTENSKAELDTKELQEHLKEAGFKEKELTEARKILQETVWPKAAKKLKGFCYSSM